MDFDISHLSALKLPIYHQVFIDAPYADMHQKMLDYTLHRIDAKKHGKHCVDMLWVVEHLPVYTLGQAGRRTHILAHTDTPIIHTDRGGQVTWHGKGQLVVYLLIDLVERGLSVRGLVDLTENALVDALNAYLPLPYIAKARKDAPGVYIYNGNDECGKIASLGYKIKHGCSYHGLALNLCNAHEPFLAINPCGYANMKMLRAMDFGIDIYALSTRLLQNLAHFIAHTKDKECIFHP